MAMMNEQSFDFAVKQLLLPQLKLLPAETESSDTIVYRFANRLCHLRRLVQGWSRQFRRDFFPALDGPTGMLISVKHLKPVLKKFSEN